MADELSPKKLFEPSTEEPKKDPLDAQPIPQIFQGGGEQIVSYDFSDFTRNRGYKAFDLIKGSSGAIMVFDSGYLNSSTSVNQGSEVISASANFSGAIFITSDLPFIVPKILKGDCYIYGYYANGAGWNSIQDLISGAIFKYDGSTETLISNWGSDSPGIAQTINVDYPYLIKVTIPNSIHFKTGESLRIKEILNTKGTTSGPASAAIWFTSNRSTAGINKILVPFKLDI